MTTDERHLDALIRKAVKEEVINSTRFLANAVTSVAQRVTALEGRSDMNSIRVKQQETAIQKLATPQNYLMIILHFIGVSVYLATHYVK